MPVSDGFKTLLARGVWARTGDALIEIPEDAGIDRAEGWDQRYEQIGSGALPEIRVSNNHHHEITAALADIAGYGVLPWDGDVDYRPAAGVVCFVSGVSGLWWTDVNTGPAYGNVTDPETTAQTTWKVF